MLQGEWKSDGTNAEGKATLEVTLSGESTSLEMTTTGGSPMNLMYQMEYFANYYCFQVAVTEMPSRSSSLSVGIVRPEEFKKGYGIKGMFYNGNLTNGSAALKVSYGPRVSQAALLVLEYIESDSEIKMILNCNGDSLGTAFRIPKAKEESSFVPCISVSGKMKIQTTILSEIPEINQRLAHPLVGKWNVSEASHNEKQFLPVSGHANKDIVLSVEQQDDAIWALSIRVCNILSVGKALSPGPFDRQYTLEDIDGQGAVCSTRMMAPPPFGQIEAQLSECMKSIWVGIQLSDDHKALQILSKRNTVVLKCTRQELSEAALTSYK